MSQAPGCPERPSGPGLERGEKASCRELLGKTYVAHHSREPAMTFGRLDLQTASIRCAWRMRSRRSIFVAAASASSKTAPRAEARGADLAIR